MLVTWGFTPKVLGYIPNVRGVITGLVDQQQPTARHLIFPDTAQYGGVIPSTAASVVSEAVDAVTSNIPLLRAATSGQAAGIIGQLPVLRLVAEEISRPLRTSVAAPSYAERPAVPAVVSGQQGRWSWKTTFLGSLTATLRKEVVGVMPDSFRINWHVIEGTFVGPGMEATILPGATDWSRIRKDGIGTVNVQATLETRTGERIYARYGGLFDLGPNGYARALQDDFDPFPPVVVTPVYVTAAKQLEWLNRVQCIGVGRMDMSTLRLEFDVYAIRVDDRLNSRDANRSE